MRVAVWSQTTGFSRSVPFGYDLCRHQGGLLVADPPRRAAAPSVRLRPWRCYDSAAAPGLGWCRISFHSPRMCRTAAPLQPHGPH